MQPKNIVMAVVGSFIAILLLSVTLGSFYTIGEGERGVQLRNGKVVGLAEPGLGFKIPFIESVSKISVQTFTVKYDKLQAYSRDQQPAGIRASVTFHVPASEVLNVYTMFGDIDRMVERLINRQVPNQVENIFGKYTAISAVQERAKFVTDVSNGIKNGITGPVVIDSVQLENIDFSDAYEKSVEARMKAEVEVQTQKQNLDKEKVSAEIAVTQAQARADSQLAQAKADALGITLKGEAEAGAIKKRADALSQNQNLVELTKAEKWDGKLPTTVIPGNATPFLSVGK
ncbi:prohibitin family protein [Pseudomonas sp.]|uniref:prohibitin family protein n=1 Tax=Pseudomonas sp. TaxID=306 RepID=UPI003FD84F58